MYELKILGVVIAHNLSLYVHINATCCKIATMALCKATFFIKPTLYYCVPL